MCLVSAFIRQLLTWCEEAVLSFLCVYFNDMMDIILLYYKVCTDRNWHTEHDLFNNSDVCLSDDPSCLWQPCYLRQVSLRCWRVLKVTSTLYAAPAYWFSITYLKCRDHSLYKQFLFSVLITWAAAVTANFCISKWNVSYFVCNLYCFYVSAAFLRVFSVFFKLISNTYYKVLPHVSRWPQWSSGSDFNDNDNYYILILLSSESHQV